MYSFILKSWNAGQYRGLEHGHVRGAADRRGRSFRGTHGMDYQAQNIPRNRQSACISPQWVILADRSWRLTPFNVLLDDNFEPPVAESGIKDLLKVSARPEILNSVYAAPESLDTFNQGAKADVYSFGVVLLEEMLKVPLNSSRAVHITPSMANELIQILKTEGVEFVVAPYEADAQLAYLSRLEPEKGGIVAVISEDSDLMAYGCNVVL